MKKINPDQTKTLKKLTHELAHEINNILCLSNIQFSIIKKNTQDVNKLFECCQKFYEKDLNPDLKPPKQNFEIDLNAKNELENAIKIIEKSFKQLQDIAYNLVYEDISNPIKIDINHCIENTLSIIKANIGEKIEIKTTLSKLPTIDSYRGLLNQAFINLVKNAMEAIQKKSNLKNESINIQTSQEGDNIIITIQDSGVGMNDETKNKLFSPSYTTKNSLGHGIGLSIVDRIIKKHHGTINITSEIGKGSIFTITLPISKI